MAENRNLNECEYLAHCPAEKRVGVYNLDDEDPGFVYGIGCKQSDHKSRCPDYRDFQSGKTEIPSYRIAKAKELMDKIRDDKDAY
jgi:hypothetical protein